MVLHEAEVAILTDDDVVDDKNLHKRRSFDQPDGDLAIRFAWFGVPGRMIVGEDDPLGDIFSAHFRMSRQSKSVCVSVPMEIVRSAEYFPPC